MNCEMCDKLLVYGERKTCKGDCTRVKRNLQMQVIRQNKRLNKTMETV